MRRLDRLVFREQAKVFLRGFRPSLQWGLKSANLLSIEGGYNLVRISRVIDNGRVP